MGRAAAGNGNGRAVLPPAIPTPVSLHRQPIPHHRGTRLAGRILGWLAVALVVLVAGLGGGAYLFFHESVAAVRPHSKDVRVAQRQLDVALPGKAAIALLIGYDKRAGQSNIGSRSDTIMLLRADPATKTISMLSLPRDLTVPVECPGRPTFVGRINAAYSECGARGTLETVKSVTGLPINYLIAVDFHAFKEIVNRVGGVWIDVDHRYYNKNVGTAATDYSNINLEPGYQRLTGGSALAYVRFRHTDSDLVRVVRQQEFVRALKEQIVHSFSLLELPKIIGAITHNVEVGVGGGGKLTGQTVFSYALFAYRLPPGHFFQARIQGLTGYSELTTSSSNIQTAVNQFLTPNVAAPKQATQVALGIKPKPKPGPKAPAPAKTSITVLNGNGVAGAASNAGYLLAQRGYRVFTPPSGKSANAPSFNYFHTKVYYDRASAGARLAASKVATLFGAADVAKLPAQLAPWTNGAMLLVVVGTTFHDTLAPPPQQVAAQPTREPAAVRSDASATRDLLLGVRKKVPFRLELPTVLETSSYPDRVKPIYAYRITRGRKAVRLVFRTGGGEYWGIEETAWTGAPVLSDRNSTHRIGGREYGFYYSGSHLHMIVLRENGATYWVVNTLLDSLSNETMIAIAKGLRPLGK